MYFNDPVESSSFGNRVLRYPSFGTSRQTSLDPLLQGSDTVSRQISARSSTYDNPSFDPAPVRMEQRIFYEYGGPSAPSPTRQSSHGNPSYFTLQPTERNQNMDSMPVYAQVNRSSSSQNFGDTNRPPFEERNNMIRRPSNIPSYAQVNRMSQPPTTYSQMTMPLSASSGSAYDHFQRFQIEDPHLQHDYDPPDYEWSESEKEKLSSMLY